MRDGSTSSHRPAFIPCQNDWFSSHSPSLLCKHNRIFVLLLLLNRLHGIVNAYARWKLTLKPFGVVLAIQQRIELTRFFGVRICPARNMVNDLLIACPVILPIVSRNPQRATGKRKLRKLIITSQSQH
jgi:hypothetical protein